MSWALWNLEQFLLIFREMAPVCLDYVPNVLRASRHLLAGRSRQSPAAAATPVNLGRKLTQRCEAVQSCPDELPPGSDFQRSCFESVVWAASWNSVCRQQPARSPASVLNMHPFPGSPASSFCCPRGWHGFPSEGNLTLMLGLVGDSDATEHTARIILSSADSLLILVISYSNYLRIHGLRQEGRNSNSWECCSLSVSVLEAA